MNHELVDVKALVNLDYDGQSYQCGDWLKVRAVDALTLGESRRVSLTREYGKKTRTVLPPGIGLQKPKRGTYKRRDLVAE